jgi:D-alanyl-D-alanine carboxypeptidase
VVNANRPFPLRNTNQLLFALDVPGVNGVKTGFTDRAGDSLVASVDRNGRRVLVVVLGTPNRTAVTAGLIDFAYRYFAWVGLSPTGVAQPQQQAASPPVMVPAWQKFYVKYSFEPATVRAEMPGPAQPLGVLRAFVGRDEVARQAVYANQS